MKKKILMCYHSSEYGGIEIQILDIIRGLSSDFDFIVATKPGTLTEKYIEAGASKVIDLYPKSEIDIGYIKSIKALIKEEKIEIVHAHELRTGVQAIWAAKFAGAKKRIYHVHTPFLMWVHSGFKKYISFLPNWILNFLTANFAATDVLALTPSIKTFKETKELVFVDKLRLIPNAVEIPSEIQEIDLTKYKIFNEDFVIGYVARFTAEKGHSDLINAFSKTSKTHTNSKLLLISDGELRSNLENQVKQLNLVDKVIFTGRVSDSEKLALIKRMDLYVNPTHAEGFGISLLEAMRMQKAILSSNLQVLKDVGGNGVIYISVGDIDSMSNEMNQLISDTSKRANLSQNAYTKSLDYTYQIFWDNYRKLYLNNE